AAVHRHAILKLAQIFPDGVVGGITINMILIFCGIGRGF
ncbi:unnamed protein product, partial [Rotaria sp. Silwood1]